VDILDSVHRINIWIYAKDVDGCMTLRKRILAKIKRMKIPEPHNSRGYANTGFKVGKKLAIAIINEEFDAAPQCSICMKCEQEIFNFYGSELTSESRVAEEGTLRRNPCPPAPTIPSEQIEQAVEIMTKAYCEFEGTTTAYEQKSGQGWAWICDESKAMLNVLIQAGWGPR